MHISDTFFDKYIGLVSPIYMTGYFYLVRHRKSLYSASAICEELSIATPTLRKLLRFWKEQDVLTYDWKEDGTIAVTLRTDEKSFDETSYTEAKALLEDPEFSSVLQMTKSVFPNFSKTDLARLAAVWTKYGFRKDMFVVLLKSCKDHEARYPSYLFTIAKKWNDAEIRTVDAAMAWMDGLWGTFCTWKKRYGNSSIPSDKDIAVFREWHEKYTPEQVTEAIDATILYTGKEAVNYTSKVLQNREKAEKPT